MPQLVLQWIGIVKPEGLLNSLKCWMLSNYFLYWSLEWQETKTTVIFLRARATKHPLRKVKRRNLHISQLSVIKARPASIAVLPLSTLCGNGWQPSFQGNPYLSHSVTLLNLGGGGREQFLESFREFGLTFSLPGFLLLFKKAIKKTK